MILKIIIYICLSNLYSQNIKISTTDYIEYSTNSYSSIYELLNEIKNEIELTNQHKLSEIRDVLLKTKEKINFIKNHEKIVCKEDNIQNALLILRKSILSYFLKTNKYPANLEEMVPQFIDCIPTINIYGDYNFRIKYIRTNKFDRKYETTIDNTTEYIYFSDPQSIYWGLIIINSNKLFEENFLYKY